MPLPKKGFKFSLDATTVYEELFEYTNDEGEVHRRLTYWLKDFWEHNQDKIDALGRYFFGAAIALVLQLVFWSWMLIDTMS